MSELSVCDLDFVKTMFEMFPIPFCPKWFECCPEILLEFIHNGFIIWTRMTESYWKDNHIWRVKAEK
ncbi:MAG: hypothetical protein QXR76_03345 [Candidatus Bathyarchaeia archaeon]